MSFFGSSRSSPKGVTLEDINPNVRNTKYEVRGEIYLAAVARKEAGKEGKLGRFFPQHHLFYE
jgi:hypothetical protein